MSVTILKKYQQFKQNKNKAKTMEEQIIIKENDVRQSETIGKLALALSKAQNEFNKAIADSKNPFYKSKYADLSTVINATRESLFLNEIALIQLVSGDQNSVSVTTKLIHSSGEWIDSTIKGKPAKQDCQQQGAVITYLRRYAQAAILNISQLDDDFESGMMRNKEKNIAVSESELHILDKLIKELSEPSVIQNMYKAYNIKIINELPKKHFNEAVKALKKRIDIKNNNKQ